MPTVVKIPTTRDSNRTYDLLFEAFQVSRTAIRADRAVVFDFTECLFLHQNAVAFLGGLIKYLHHHKCTVEVDLSSLDSGVRSNLRRNGFLASFGFEQRVGDPNSIPFRVDSERDDDGYLNYLRDEWLGHGWVVLSDGVKDAISTAVWEIYTNGFEHSESELGVFSCGQYYPKKREMSLSFLDFGIGIPESVRTVPSVSSLGDCAAIEWALAIGNTSKPGNRGVGLDILRAFVMINKGRLDVVSLNGHVRIANDGLVHIERKNCFPGTLFNLTLIADERRYVFKNET